MIAACLNGIYGLYASFGSIPEAYGRRILRLCVFQHPENAGIFERTIIKIYKFFTQGICSTGYDHNRAKRGWQVLAELGAKMGDIQMENQSINYMEWDPKDLEDKIKKLGGSWDRFTLGTGQVLAIKPPENPSEAWKALEVNLLKLWPKENGLIITCASADEVSEKEKLVIQVNSASTSYIMMREKMGVFMGCKKKLVCFDPPGTALSKGFATEASYYEAIKKVYDTVVTSFSPENVWVCGACLGCPSIAYLRAQIPNINLILENSSVDPKEDMAKPDGRLVYWFASRYWGALLRGDAKETGFNIAKTWQSAVHSSLGKILVISVDNDQRLSKDVAKNLVASAGKINQKVFHLHYESLEKDPHWSRFEKLPHIRKQVVHYIFSN